MQRRLLTRFATFILFLACLGAAQALVQEAKTPQIGKAVYWSAAGSGVDVYLFHKSNQTYRLAVVTKGDVKVTYRTSINSVEPVVKELAPVETLGGVVHYFEFDHYFSKMTIWMALEFTVEGKRVPGLTRAFYDDIFTLVPPDMFLDRGNKRP